MILIASDHAGFELKKYIINQLKEESFIDLGCDSLDSVDYPDYAYLLAKEIKNQQAKFGILICGTGIGMSIAANRFTYIRAALCTSALMAQKAREHNDANVLVLGARITDNNTALECIKTFIATKFLGERHNNRVEKLKEIANE
jgi:ribose 5-phosphate isomerase B